MLLREQFLWRLIGDMTLDEKLSLMHGELHDPHRANQAGYVAGIARLGIPDVFVADGESGVNVTWEATALPAKVSLAATFDTNAAFEYGEVLGREAREAGVHIILSSRVNIVRDPVAQIERSNGGNFQTLSEDPLLNAQLAIAEVKGIERENKAIANLKQFFGSSTGASQGAENSVIDEQAMFEIYLLPFEMVIKAGVGSMMTSYNQVNGVWTYRHELLQKLVREQWGFGGIIFSDWYCLYSPKAVKGGVTMEMPEDVSYGERLKAEVLDPASDVTMADIDQCVYYYLDTLYRYGMLNEKRTPGPVSDALKRRHIPVARKLAAQGAVLLKNAGVLPLNPAVSSLAVIGPTGRACAMPVFKEAAFGFSDRKQSPLQALQEMTGKQIPFEEGNDLQGELIPARCYRNLIYYRTRYEIDPIGERDLGSLPTPISREVHRISAVDFRGDHALGPVYRPDEYYLFTGELRPEETGWHRLCLQSSVPNIEAHERNNIGNRDMFCFTSGDLYIQSPGESHYRCIGVGTRTAMNGGVVPNSDVVPCEDGWNNAAGFVYLEAGKVYRIAATATSLYHEPVEVRLAWSTPSRRRVFVERAARLAGKVEIPIVFAWHKSPSASIRLQEEQDELIEAVAAANPNTVVVLNNGDPVTMPWLNKVAAVLEMWFPGQEGGYATADVLLGRSDPGGRLPVTFPMRLEDTAAHDPNHPERCAPCGKVPLDEHVAENVAYFTEGIFTGYRWFQKTDTKPLFPFGYGLSYARFEISCLGVSDSEDGGKIVRCRVANTSERKGVCVVQCYLGRPDVRMEGIQVAEKALAAFDSLALAPGEEKTVDLNIPPRSFQYWATDVEPHGWRRLNAPRKLWIGTSSEELPIAVDVR